MTTDTRYDVIIIGAGPAGLFCAAQAGAAGKKVLLIEKNPVAGKNYCFPVRASAISPMTDL